MRRRLMSILMTLVAAAIAVVALPALPASAGIWHTYPDVLPGTNRTCSDTNVHNGTAYQVCLDFDEPRTKVRTVAYINPGAYTNFQVNIRLAFGDGGATITDSCPTMTTNASRACYTAFTAVRRPYVIAEATFGIAGTWQLPVRALDMKLSAKVQERSNWCGPAAAQTALATMGYSAPSQSELAGKLGTDSGIGVTWPSKIPGVLNQYIPAGDWEYRFEQIPVRASNLYAAGVAHIITSLNRGRPVIVLVAPGELPWNDYESGALRHYVTINGYGGVLPGDGKVWARTFTVTDPATGFEHSIGVNELLQDNAGKAWAPIDTAAIITT